MEIAQVIGGFVIGYLLAAIVFGLVMRVFGSER